MTKFIAVSPTELLNTKWRGDPTEAASGIEISGDDSETCTVGTTDISSIVYSEDAFTDIQSHSITFYIKDGIEEILRLSPDGHFYVRGIKSSNDAEIMAALKVFMKDYFK